jgi:hypothetical protein
MRLPHFRFTVRRPIVAVAVVGILLGVGIEGERRRERFESRIKPHRDKLLTLVVSAYSNAAIEHYSEPDKRKYYYHYLMVAKYHWAARYPWFPVWPDPPEPE